MKLALAVAAGALVIGGVPAGVLVAAQAEYGDSDSARTVEPDPDRADPRRGKPAWAAGERPGRGRDDKLGAAGPPHGWGKPPGPKGAGPPHGHAWGLWLRCVVQETLRNDGPFDPEQVCGELRDRPGRAPAPDQPRDG